VPANCVARQASENELPRVICLMCRHSWARSAQWHALLHEPDGSISPGLRGAIAGLTPRLSSPAGLQRGDRQRCLCQRQHWCAGDFRHRAADRDAEGEISQY